jgi:hypothetical protein
MYINIRRIKNFTKSFAEPKSLSIFAVMATKQNRSKYNFGKMKIGDALKVEPLELMSLKNSLRAFNKRHGLSIEVLPYRSNENEVTVIRVK